MALHDVLYIYNYVVNFNQRAAGDLMKELIVAGDSLVDFPYRGRPVADNLRELTIVYPYIIRYEITGNQVTILRVRHGMRQ